MADEMSVRGHHVPQRLGNYPVPQPQDVQQDPVMQSFNTPGQLKRALAELYGCPANEILSLRHMQKGVTQAEMPDGSRIALFRTNRKFYIINPHIAYQRDD